MSTTLNSRNKYVHENAEDFKMYVAQVGIIFSPYFIVMASGD